MITFNTRRSDRHAAGLQRRTHDRFETNGQGLQDRRQRVRDAESFLQVLQVRIVRRTGTNSSNVLNSGRDIVNVLLDMFGNRISAHVVSFLPLAPLDASFLYSWQAT